LLKEHEGKLPKRGVVHSFTGTLEEMKELVSLGWDIGINGCSLKTVENCEVVKQIPLERLQLETDGPWCEIRASHASSECLRDFKDGERWKWVKKEKWEEGALVKGRNESALIGKVVWVVAKLKGVSLEVVCEAAWGNSVRMFGLGEGVKAE
jgi:TatD DNase family protein